MAAPSGCIELRLEGSSAPRVLRGGSQVACCRSTCSESLEQQFEHSMRRLTGDPRQQGSRGLLGEFPAAGHLYRTSNGTLRYNRRP